MFYLCLVHVYCCSLNFIESFIQLMTMTITLQWIWPEIKMLQLLVMPLNNKDGLKGEKKRGKTYLCNYSACY